MKKVINILRQRSVKCIAHKNLLFIMMLGATSIAYANSPQEKQAYLKNAIDALHEAQRDLISRHQNAEQFSIIYYEKELVDTEGNSAHFSFDGSKPQDKQWTEISSIGKSLSGVKMPGQYMLSPTIIDELALTFYDHSEDFWIFKGDMDLYDDNNKDPKDRGETSDTDFDQYLVAFVRIDKKTKRFRELNFTNMEDFSPSLLANIESFKIENRYEPVGTNGPLIRVHSKLEISGRYALLYSFNEGIEQTLRNFKIAE